MDIYPEDLGPRHCQQVLKDRLLHGGKVWGSSATPPVSPSGRVQAKPESQQISNREAIGGCFGLLAVWLVLYGLFHDASVWTVLTVAIIGFLWQRKRGGQTTTPSPMQQGSAEPQAGTYARLTEPEVTQLQNSLVRNGGDDPLLGMYLELVWAVMHLAPLATSREDTERSAREAIRALGGAIEALPPQTVEGVPDSHAKLQAVAARLASEAAGETDPVVAASLGRRVEALRGQAETVARVRVLLRRNMALREEMADQIGALRTSLVAATLGGDDSGPELAGVAARIRRVASEANAVTAARVEVDTLLSQTRADVPTVQEEVRQQRVGLNGETL